MPIKAVVGDLETVPEPFREMYKPSGDDGEGRFVLDVEAADGFELGNIGQLRQQYGEAERRASDLEKALKSYQGIKEKPSELVKKLQRLQELEQIDPDSEADKRAAASMQAREDALHQEWQEKSGQYESKLSSMQKHLDKLTRINTARTAITKFGGDATLLEPFVLNRVRVNFDEEGDDGLPKVEVLDDRGAVHYAVRDGKVAPATVEDLVLEMRNDPRFGKLFDASGVSGTGARPQAATNGAGGGVKTMKREAFERLAPQAQMSFSKSGGRLVD